MRKTIPLRYRVYAFALLMSAVTGSIVSAIIMGLHATTMAGFLHAWPAAFLTAWPIVFVAILVIAPRVNDLIDLFVERG
ncbi:MAG TPA: DUF2798 domain-containing protein [Methylophilaceae bacterium]|nr:DUF2798 domain-containing protein [Methylophilaceae bacterium]